MINRREFIGVAATALVWRPRMDDVTIVQFSDRGERVGPVRVSKVVKSDEEWRKQLAPLAYQITRMAGTERALAATADAEVITVPAFTGAAEQLWRIDQLTDGTYRIMPKVVPNSNKKLALVSSGDSTPTLGEFDMNSDNSKWNFKVY